MEKNGREASEIVPHSIWIYLPTELWFQIFRYLRATRYIALIGVLSKGFREFVIEYFKTVSGWMNKNMNVAIIGVPDVGKTTMIAQLLLQSRQKNIENQFRHFVHQNPKTPVTSIYNTFLNSHYTSPTIHTQQVHPFYLNTSLHNFTFFDTPGWRRVIKAYRICAQADTAILVLNRGHSFDSEWLINGVSAILTSLTHSHFIIAINYTRTSFTQSAWEADQTQVHEKLTKAVPPKLLANIKVIPINALDGFNIYSPHAGIEDSKLWYTGPSLYRALHAVWEKLEYPEEREQMPFSMTVVRTCRILGVGPVLVGIVNSGCLKPGMKVRLCSAGSLNKPLVINAIQHNRVPIAEAKPSDYVGISFASVSLNHMKDASYDLLKQAKYGMLVTDYDRPAKRVQSFVAAIAITSTKAGQLREGRQYKAIYQGNHIYVVFEKFIQVLDKHRNDVARKTIAQGDSCLALCVPTQEMWTYPKASNPGKNTNTNKKKDSKDVILFTTQRRIHAVGRIDTITFFDKVENQPPQFAHKKPKK
jgi:translation elongation factor EF-1alpha